MAFPGFPGRLEQEMNYTFSLFGYDVLITGWKLIGYLGTIMFTGRWFVQMHYSRKAGRPIIPLGYWLMSMAGSLLLLSYFVWGKNDSVGILNNCFPFFIASFNLYLELTHRRKNLSPAAP